MNSEPPYNEQTSQSTHGIQLRTREYHQYIYDPDYYYVIYLWKVNKDVNMYFPIALIIIACLGNILSLVVYSRRTFSKNVTSFYFRCLAVCDTCAIISGMIPSIIMSYFEIHYANSDFTCGLANFLRCLTFEYSVYILILVTLERYIGVCYPLKAKAICTMKNAVISVIAAGFVAVLRNIFYLFSMKLSPSASGVGGYICHFNDKYATYYTTVEPFLSIVLSVLIPFTIMFVLNIGIAIRVFRAHRQRAALSSMAGNSNRPQGTTGLTVTLMTVTFTFLILSIPDSISKIQYFFFNIKFKNINNTTGLQEALQVAQISLWYHLAYFITSANNAVNFFLYCLSGKVFRRELCAMIKEVQQRILSLSA